MNNFEGNGFRVLVPTALFGTVRVSKGDVVRKELLLGFNCKKLVESGVVEPATVQASPKQVAAILM